MKNFDSRLSKLEAAAAILDGPIISALVAFIEQQPPDARASFFRCCRAELNDDTTDDVSLDMCGGVFALQVGDETTYAGLLAAFFGDDDDGCAPSWPSPDPAPAKILERVNS